MESWQVDRINKNLPYLLSNTKCNVQLLAEFTSRNLLSDVDVDMIQAERTEYDKTNQMYKILKTRTNAYDGLINALTATRQTGALKILIRLSADTIKNLKVNFLGNVSKINHLLDNRQITSIQKWFNKNMPGQEYVNLNEYIKEKKHLTLLADTIPKPYSLYVPRLLTRRLIVNPEAFQRILQDVFIFKNVSKPRLQRIIQHGIDSSTNQVQSRNLTVRFIISDSDADWERICRKTNCPAHLIKYEESINEFELEKTFGYSVELSEYLKQKGESVYEDMFVNMCLEQSQNVCICDSPGMGKSLLLANLARKVQNLHPNRLVSFIQLKDLVPKEECGNMVEVFCIKSKIFEAITTSTFASRIVNEITNSQNTKLELFLDGFDEIPISQLKSTTSFLRTLSESMPNARFYITSRTVMRSILEEALDVIAYDIQPFKKEAQINFLTSHWVQHNSLSNVSKLKEYAEICLQNVASSLKEKEKAITGIPLQCRLIAEVYAEEAEIYADPGRSVSVNLTNFTKTSLLQIYSKYVLSQLRETRCNFACMHMKSFTSAHCSEDCFIKNFHVWKALELIFPKFAKRLASRVPSSVISEYTRPKLEDWNRRKVMSPGLLIITCNAGCSKVEFVHRTFAEYLVAEYFVKAIFVESSERFHDSNLYKELQQLGIQEVFSIIETEAGIINFSTPGTAFLSILYPALFDALIFAIYHWTHSIFRQNVVAYFLNSMLAQTPSVIEHLRTVDFPLNTHRCFEYALLGCAREDYETLVDIIVNTKPPTSTFFTIDILPRKFRIYKLANITLKLAITHCGIVTIKKLEQYFSGHLNRDNVFTNDMLLDAMKRADYDIVCLISEKLELQKKGFLYFCVKNTYLQDDDLVEKKLAIAELLLSKCSVLLTESYKLWGGARYVDCISPLLSPQIHLKVVKFLVRKGANIWIVDENDLTVLHLAAHYMSTEDFIQLCNFLFVECNAENIFLQPVQWKKFCYGFNGNQRISTNKLLSLLYYLYSLELGIQVQLLFEDQLLELLKCLQESQTLYSKYEQGFVALFFLALLEGNVEVVELLFSSNNLFLEMEFENENNQTPLLIATKYEQERMITFLISKGANIYQVDAEGNTILHLLARTGNCSLFHKVLKILGKLWHSTLRNMEPVTSIQYFLSRNTTPENLTELFNWKRQDSLQTPLHYVMKYLLNIPLETLELFLNGGTLSETCQKNTGITSIVDINAVDNRNESILYCALDNKQNLTVIKHLVNLGADWSKRTVFGYQVLRVCRRRNLPDHLTYFKELG